MAESLLLFSKKVSGFSLKRVSEALRLADELKRLSEGSKTWHCIKMLTEDTVRPDHYFRGALIRWAWHHRRPN